MNKILVVTNVIPGSGSTAGNALEKIIKSTQSFYEINYLVVGENFSVDPVLRTPYRTFFTCGPKEDWSSVAPFGKIAEALTSLDSKKIGKRIDSLIEKLSPEFVILDIQSHSVLLSLEHVDLSNTKSILVMWDHWTWRYKVFKSSNSSRRSLDLIREKLLLSSEKIVVPSQEFKEYLIQQQLAVEKNVVVLYLPIEGSKNSFLPGPAARHINKTRVIGFAGQQYALNELEDLLQAVEHINDLGTREYKIEVHIFSRSQLFAENKSVVYRGFVPPALLVENLTECEILFLPYPFDSDLKLVSGLSFPSKFTQYLEARRPVIFYGPATSPLSQLLLERHYPFLIGNRSIGSIVHVLHRALDSLELQLKAEGVIENLINVEFSMSIFNDGLEQLGLLNLIELQQLSVQNSLKINIWRPLLFSNLMLRLTGPLLPVFLKIRHIRHRFSATRILYFSADKLKVYFESKNKKKIMYGDLEKDWQNGTI